MTTKNRRYVACGACGKKCLWKPEMAGRSFKCTCGNATLVPPEQSSSGKAEVDNEYDLADAPPTPTPLKPKPVAGAIDAEAVRARMGAVPRVRKTLTDATAEASAKQLADMLEPSPMRDIVVPIIVMAIGLVLSFWEVRRALPHPPATVIGAVVLVVIRAVTSMTIMVGGIFLSTAVFEVSIVGSFQKCIFRLCAIAIGPSALYGLLGYLLGDVAGSTAGVFASVLVYGVLFFYLLKLDLKDTSVCVLVTWVLVTAVNYAVFRVQGASHGSWL